MLFRSLAIYGAVVARRRSVSLLPFGATLVAVVVNAAVSWGTPRFRVPLEINAAWGDSWASAKS